MNSSNNSTIGWKPGEFDPDDLPGLLGRLTEAMLAVGDPMLAILRPGLSEDEVRSRFKSAGVEPHPDLVEWFKWTAGHRPGGPSPRGTAPVDACLPIESIFEEMRSFDGMMNNPDYPHYVAGAHVPFLTAAAVDCSHGVTAGQVLEVRTHPDTFHYLDSLAPLIWFWIAVREEGLLSDLDAQKDLDSSFAVVRHKAFPNLLISPRALF